LGSELQKSVPAEADGAVHITPAAKVAAAAPTVAINTLAFMVGFLFCGDDGTLSHYVNPGRQIFLAGSGAPELTAARR
jgi:hypothetical protein